MRCFEFALLVACSLVGGEAICQPDSVCLAERQKSPGVAAVAPVLLQMQGSLHTLHDPSALGAAGGFYPADLYEAAPADSDAQPDPSAGDPAGAVIDVSLNSELQVATEAGGSEGVQVLEGSSIFARELPTVMESSFGEEVDGGDVSATETSGAAEANSVAETEPTAENPEGQVIEVLLNSELQLAATVDVNPSVANAPDDSSVSTAELPQGDVGGDKVVADHTEDQADGTVVDVPLNSQLEVSATTADNPSAASAHIDGASPISGETTSPSDSDLVDKSSNTIDGTQDRDPTGDRGDQAARDDNDLAEDSTDGIPGEGINHQEGGHVDPSDGSAHKTKIDRLRYDEDWASEWKDGGNNTHHGQATRAEVVKNSLAILGRRPQVAATVVVVAAFFATRSR